MFLADLGSLLFSLAGQRDVAYLGRLLVGFGVGVIFVSTFKMQSTWFRASEFATISGLTSIVGNTGGILATTPLAILVVNFGWRSTLDTSMGSVTTFSGLWGVPYLMHLDLGVYPLC